MNVIYAKVKTIYLFIILTVITKIMSHSIYVFYVDDVIHLYT